MLAHTSADRARQHNKGPKTKPINQQGIGASSSRLTPEEHARSLILHTTDEVEDSVPHERPRGPEPEYDGSADADSVPSTIEYPEIIWLI